jgi:hypothetical protein
LPKILFLATHPRIIKSAQDPAGRGEVSATMAMVSMNISMASEIEALMVMNDELAIAHFLLVIIG